MRLRIILFLIFGPIIGLTLGYRFIDSIFDLQWRAFPDVVLIFAVAVIIEAAIIRANTGIKNRKAYTTSILINLVSIVPIVVIGLVLLSLSAKISMYATPILVAVFGIAYRIKRGANIISSVAVVIVGAYVIWHIAGLFIWGAVAYSYAHLPYNLKGFIVFLIVLSFFKPLIEVWPAASFIPDEKLDVTVLLANLALLLFFSVCLLQSVISYITWFFAG